MRKLSRLCQNTVVKAICALAEDMKPVKTFETVDSKESFEALEPAAGKMGPVMERVASLEEELKTLNKVAETESPLLAISERIATLEIQMSSKEQELKDKSQKILELEVRNRDLEEKSQRLIELEEKVNQLLVINNKENKVVDRSVVLKTKRVTTSKKTGDEKLRKAPETVIVPTASSPPKVDESKKKSTRQRADTKTLGEIKAKEPGQTSTTSDKVECEKCHRSFTIRGFPRHKCTSAA